MDILVQRLIADGVVVNTSDERGRTPLRAAAYGGHFGIARLLLENGADVNAKDEDSRAPLSIAARSGHKR